MRSFRGSIARPSYLLCTLHAAITDDYATLAYRLVAILCRVVISGDRVHSVNFNVFQHLLQLRTFHGAMMSDPDALGESFFLFFLYVSPISPST